MFALVSLPSMKIDIEMFKGGSGIIREVFLNTSRDPFSSYFFCHQTVMNCGVVG